MKRILIILAVLLTGCDDLTEPGEKVQSRTELKGSGYLKTYSHDGHKFIVFSEWGYNAGAGGLVHHPDCGCKK